jgi:putative transposase
LKPQGRSLNGARFAVQICEATSERPRDKIIEIAQARHCFGYRRIHALLRREGESANAKRVYRLYRQENLSVRRRRKRSPVAFAREPLSLPAAANQTWSMDFVWDAMSNGRKLKC